MASNDLIARMMAHLANYRMCASDILAEDDRVPEMRLRLLRDPSKWRRFKWARSRFNFRVLTPFLGS